MNRSRAGLHLPFWLNVLFCLALVLGGLLPATPAQAAIIEFVAGMSTSGTAPFQTTGPLTCVVGGTATTPGDDPCGADNVIRTNDYAIYRMGYTLDTADTDALVTLQTGTFTVPATYTGPALTEMTYFDVVDMPTGANGCQNISATAVSDPPPAGVSGITADGLKLFCVQPSPVSGNNHDFRMRIRGDAPNGATVSAPTVTFESLNNAANSTPTALSGTVGSETFYGLPDLTSSAAGRWDLWKRAVRAGFQPGSGPAGETGGRFLFRHQSAAHRCGVRWRS